MWDVADDDPLTAALDPGNVLPRQIEREVGLTDGVDLASVWTSVS